MKKLKGLAITALLATGFIAFAVADSVPRYAPVVQNPAPAPSVPPQVTYPAATPGYAIPAPSGYPSIYNGVSSQAVAQEPIKPAPVPVTGPVAAPAAAAAGCAQPCGHACADCNIQCLKPWKCEDLEMKPAEKVCHPCECGWLHSLLWCPPKNGGNGGNGGNAKAEGEKKEGEAKNGEAKNGEEKKEEEAPEGPDTTLMQAIQCYHPALYAHLDCNKTKIYGWLQFGYTINPDDPDNRTNFGVNFNNRSNDAMLNQLWLRVEKALEHEKEFNIGYMLDINFGQDAPDFNVISLGMWENFTGDADLAIADDTDFGIDLPQFWVEAHLPGFITEKGMDIRLGRMLTLHGNELSPAYQTRFYSHSYGYYYAWPLSHTGFMTNLHLTDTVDWWNGVMVGWDNVFEDNNDVPHLHGMLIWTACDKNSSAWVAYTVGPEGIGQFESRNDTYRVLVTYDYSRKFGCYNEWEMVLHGGNGWDDSIFTGEEVEWYDYAANLFYTVNPQLILGTRAEWFRDDDGYRTGFADSFYEITGGFTYKPYQNLWVRPEVRFDWSDETRPFNDFSDKFQLTLAADVIWLF